MVIQGFNRMTLLDFPGKVACTVFTGGCDFRCPFCHNSALVLEPSADIDPEEIFTYLGKRRGILDGVAITGGEPLLQKDIADFLSRVKDMGYLVKLDTNGNHPEMLEGIITLKLADYIAMDIKNCPERYAETVGVKNFDISNVAASASLIMSSGIDYEFRTTAVKEFHDEDSFRGIAKFINGAKRYYIQNFVDSGALLCEDTHGFAPEQMRSFLEIVRPAFGLAELRGI